MQTSASDVEQVTQQGDRVKARERRVAELWRWLLSKPIGREFLWDVLLADVGYGRPIPTGYDGPGPSAMHAALHNLGCRWVDSQVRRNRNLYLQMLVEASKREDEERSRDASVPARDEDDSDE